MFGPKVVVVGGKTEHHHTNVQMVDPSIEKGARFLDEVQAKAHERIVHAMLLECPDIGVTVVKYEVERVFQNMTARHRIAFTINGREFDLSLNHEDWEKPERIVEIVVEKIAGAILERGLKQQPLLVNHLGFGKRF